MVDGELDKFTSHRTVEDACCSLVTYLRVREIELLHLTYASDRLGYEPYRDVTKVVVHEIKFDKIGLIQSILEVTEDLTVCDIVLL